MSLLAGLLFLPPARAQTEEGISFAERVAAFEAVERVFHDKRAAYALEQGAASAPSFEDAVPASAIIRKASDSARMRKALLALYGVELTNDALAAALDATAFNTQDEAGLRAIYAALGNSAPLMEDTIIQLKLAEAELRSRFAFDANIHAAERHLAEDLHDRAVRGKANLPLVALQSDFYGCETFRVAAPGKVNELGASQGGCVVYDLTESVFAERTANLPPAGTLTPISETEEHFLFSRVAFATAREARVERIAVPKISFSEWWEEARLSFTDNPPFPEGRFRLPPPIGRPCEAVPDAWQRTTLTNQPAFRTEISAVWTGAEMIVWGGYGYDNGCSCNTYLASGGRYNPTLDQWTPTSTLNAPTPRSQHSAVWLPSLGSNGMFVFGGWAGVNAFPDGKMYFPATDSWGPINLMGAPEARRAHTGVQVRMGANPDVAVIWGGINADGSGLLNTGGRYNAASNSWTATCDNVLNPCPIGSASPPSFRVEHTAVWADAAGRMVVWGGWNLNGALNTGGRYDPVFNSWISTSPVNAPDARSQHTAVLAPELGAAGHMIVWGGWQNGGDPTTRGAHYDIASNSWPAIDMELPGQPTGRRLHTAVWDGSQMVVWSGMDSSGFPYLQSGGHYRPIGVPSWAPARDEKAPFGSNYHRALWKGVSSGMLVWPAEFGAEVGCNPTGGAGPRTLTGGRYLPFGGCCFGPPPFR